MKIKTFIQKAIEGGYDPTLEDYDSDILKYDDYYESYMLCDHTETMCTEPISIYETLLDPKAWEAVGRVEGWDDDSDSTVAMMIVMEGNRWEAKMNGLTPALIEGKSIEEYIETL